MNKKIFIIWGGEEASNYKDFEEYLLWEEFNPYAEKTKNWKDNLLQDVWEWFEVIKIPMPNKGFAEYKYWKIMFEKTFQYFGEENIFIWHSLWGTFLLKYLNENNLENISGIHLIAPAVSDTPDEKLWSFEFDITLKNLGKFQKIINIYASKDDDIVPFSQWEYLKNIFPESNFEIFEEKGHFIFQEHFEELVRNIKKL